MLIKNPSEYLQPGDVENGGNVRFLNEGLEKTNQYGKRVYEFNLELPDGEKKKLTLNATSTRWMLAKYGKDSKKWMGLDVPVFFTKAMVAGQQKTICYIGEIPGEKSEVEGPPVENLPEPPAEE